MAGNEKSLERALGDLEGTVRALQGSLREWMENWSRQDAAATEARKSLYLRVEGLSMDLASSAAKLDAVKSDLEEMKDNISENVMPTISAYKQDAAHRLGMWAAGKLFWGMILAVCTVVGFFIQKILSSLPPKIP